MRPTELFTLDEAAIAVGRTTRTLRRWVAAGMLTSVAKDALGRHLYADSDLYEAERIARNWARALAGS